MRLGIGVVIFIAAYIGSLVLYVNGGMGRPQQIADSQSSSTATRVVVDIEDIQSNNGVLIAILIVSPGPALLDPQTRNLKDDLSVVATSVVTASKHTWSKGEVPDVFRITMPLFGDVADWPFDRYRSGPINVQLFSGPGQVPEQATVTLVDRLLGWQVDVPDLDKADANAPYRLNVYRSPSTMAFAVLILGVLITLAGLAFFVAIQTVRGRRNFQPPMTTWYAAILFAVMPLRNALPDSPPFGSWIDVTIVLWVIVALVVSLVLYISCWWHHLAPNVARQKK
ncbi:DUF4436 domain-containing protein [Mycobacterium riyadhense]|uniref:DUF4436 domain-containing protein n=1 Tax=Mycobacterium riyadhense TaxID=486698 RepID=UPI001EF9E2AB|nr:DUF4436 domain-containing protein [Mycobacterium riyadhense]